jgi:hypothetical protein
VPLCGLLGRIEQVRRIIIETNATRLEMVVIQFGVKVILGYLEPPALTATKNCRLMPLAIAFRGIELDSFLGDFSSLFTTFSGPLGLHNQ